ncbi:MULTISPECIES: hypothetical protein [Shewanella]|uniref:hypothetical protein n=1 Tax=Shewanella TaxID=22 RepID=UPI0012DF922E|nr:MULTISPECIES: hypothetical protein [Shewanella]MBO2644648.1 hypothetical protein [Shewanella algae]MCE9789526.1 hypothetical protein [Shewanella chilikensis]QGS60881.1 hypothetical protein GMX02_16030 [Shewanella algae]
MSKNQPISLGDLGQKLGIVGSVSMGAIAEKIGYEKRPIELSELAKEVDKYLEKHSKS